MKIPLQIVCRGQGRQLFFIHLIGTLFRVDR